MFCVTTIMDNTNLFNLQNITRMHLQSSLTGMEVKVNVQDSTVFRSSMT